MNENLTIKEVCEELGLTMVYVRRMIQKGKIKTTKVEMNKNQFKHLVSREEVERWRASITHRSTRDDGRNKFVLYATQDELAVIEQLLGENNIESIITRANKVKEISDASSI